MTNRGTEDYLKTIYALEQRGDRASTSALAERLQVADASITDMLKKLSRKGLVNYRRYRGAELTPEGRQVALRIIRRHRLWEMYLVRFLGYSWDAIHVEAERLEHVTSDGLERRLDEALGYPTTDPHGDPIPTADGECTEPTMAALAAAEPGAVVIVSRVSDADPEILKYASSLGIVLRKKIRVKEAVPFDGSLRVMIGKHERFISAKLAKHIFVEPAKG
jgi:DtxR family Mn-dependent transcriptional regulator